MGCNIAMSHRRRRCRGVILAAGFFRYLTKPIKVDEFMATLDEALAFAAQSAGILHTDVEALAIDALAVSTQKGLMSLYSRVIQKRAGLG